MNPPGVVGTVLAGFGPAIALGKAKALPGAALAVDPRDRVQRKPSDAAPDADPVSTAMPAVPAVPAVPVPPANVPPEVKPRADIANTMPSLPAAPPAEIANPTVQSELISAVLPGQQAEPSSGRIGIKEQTTQAARPGVFALSNDMTLIAPAGPMADRMVASVSDGLAPSVSNPATPPVDAMLTAVAPSGRKGAPAVEAETDPMVPTALAQQLDLSAASAAASHTPVNITGAIVPQAVSLGHGAPGVSIASQILPSVIALAQGHVSNDRISISLSPDMLGHVSITVDRGADGTTSIQISSERLATMELLRTDQADLLRALHQAGVSQDSHSLSFSWQGGNGGMQGWGGQGEPQGERRPAAAQFYAEETASIPSFNSAAAHGGVDVTA